MKMAPINRFLLLFTVLIQCSQQSIALVEPYVPQEQEIAEYEDSKYIEFMIAYGPEVDQIGSVIMEIIPEWAPIGVEHLTKLINDKFYDNAKFFRVLPKFILQFGLNANPKIQKKYGNELIKDEIIPFKTTLKTPIPPSNLANTVTFAMRGKNTRTTHLFINYVKNKNLDKEGFVPIGRIIKGMDLLKLINSEYKEKPDQGKITQKGNEYLDKLFPNLNYIITAKFINKFNYLNDIKYRDETIVSCQIKHYPNQPIMIHIKEEWAPIGSIRFLNLVSLGYYDNIPIFRAINDFLIQFGIYLKDKQELKIKKLLKLNHINIQNKGKEIFFNNIEDDVNLNIPFLKGMISFAGYGKSKTRAQQVFITLNKLSHMGKSGSNNNNKNMVNEGNTVVQGNTKIGDVNDNSPWERPFGYIEPSSLLNLKSFIYYNYGDLTSKDDDIQQHGPNIHKLYGYVKNNNRTDNNNKDNIQSPSEYLEKEFPKLTYIEKCEILNVNKNSSFKNVIINKDIDSIALSSSSSSSAATTTTSVREEKLKPETIFGLLFIFICTFIIVFHMLQQLGDGDINIDAGKFGDDITFKNL